jgi:DNA-binding MarR family transcriptional regulator
MTPKIKSKRNNALLDSAEVRSWRAIVNAFQTLYTSLEEGLKIDNCSYPRFQLLFLLHFEGPLSPVELSRKMKVTRANISMFLKRMSKDELVKATPIPDSKRKNYCLSKKGEQLFEQILPGHLKRVQSVVPRLDEKHIKLLESVSETDKA